MSLEVESIHPQKGEPSFKVNPAQPPNMAFVITDTSGKKTTVPITLDFDDHLLSLTTMEAMDDEFLGNRHFFDEHAPRYRSKPKLVFGTSKLPRSTSGYVPGSFVRQIRVGDEQIPGNVLTRKGFGTIQFGVTLTDSYSRRISMARISMGSDPAARVSLAGVETNGIWL